MEDRLITYGGQAVIEGVLMRGRKACAMANRAPDGSIVVTQIPLGSIYQSKLTKIPFLRGLILLWDALGLGMKALTQAANLQSGEDEKIEGGSLFAAIFFAILVVVGIFFLAPAGVGWLTERFLNWNAWWSNLLEGVIRLLFLIAYIWGIGFMPDIRRVFAYHGAEHKTVNALRGRGGINPSGSQEISHLPHPVRDSLPADIDDPIPANFHPAWTPAACLAAHQPGGDDPSHRRNRLRIHPMDCEPHKITTRAIPGETQPGSSISYHQGTG